jgi:hypothetical protein
MSHKFKSESAPGPAPVTVSDWVACINANDDIIVVSCTISTVDSSAGITGVGLILNTSKGVTLVSTYVGLSTGSNSVSPSINLPLGEFAPGDSVAAVAQGECDGKHFFFEQDLSVGNC